MQMNNLSQGRVINQNGDLSIQVERLDRFEAKNLFLQVLQPSFGGCAHGERTDND